MELLIVLTMVGAGIYFFIKNNTNRGIETVRASVFLGGMQAGVTVAEANHVAGFDVMNGPPEAIQNAMEHLRSEYGGEQSRMIGDAYSQGMHPKLPLLYRAVAGLRTDDQQIRHDASSRRATNPYSAQAQSPHWVRSFVLYFVASEFAHALPGQVPDKVRELVNEKPSGRTQQSLLTQLQIYLQHAHGRDCQHDDLSLVVVDAGIFLRAELQTLNSSLALKQFLRRNHAKDEKSPLAEHELEKQKADLVAEIKSNDDTARMIRIEMLKESVENLFEGTHRKTIAEYMREIYEADRPMN